MPPKFIVQREHHEDTRITGDNFEKSSYETLNNKAGNDKSRKHYVKVERMHYRIRSPGDLDPDS